MFLSLPGFHLDAEVTGKRINRGRGQLFELVCNYCWAGQEKAIEWIKKKMTVLIKNSLQLPYKNV